MLLKFPGLPPRNFNLSPNSYRISSIFLHRVDARPGPDGLIFLEGALFQPDVRHEPAGELLVWLEERDEHYGS